MVQSAINGVFKLCRADAPTKYPY